MAGGEWELFLSFIISFFRREKCCGGHYGLPSVKPKIQLQECRGTQRQRIPKFSFVYFRSRKSCVFQSALSPSDNTRGLEQKYI